MATKLFEGVKTPRSEPMYRTENSALYGFIACWKGHPPRRGEPPGLVSSDMRRFYL
jgi:hypothetical protein